MIFASHTVCRKSFVYDAIITDADIAKIPYVKSTRIPTEDLYIDLGRCDTFNSNVGMQMQNIER
jgi:hypothetical protein